MGERRSIKCVDVQVMQLPHYENLTVEKLFEFAETYDNGDPMTVFPEVRKERLKLQRSYIGNCIYTIVG